MVGIDTIKQKRNEEDFLAFRKLFRAVLAQAVHDAFIYVPKNNYEKLARSQALVFFEGGDDLRIICELAEVSYDRIVKAAKDLTHNGHVDHKKIMDILKKKY